MAITALRFDRWVARVRIALDLLDSLVERVEKLEEKLATKAKAKPKKPGK